MLPLGPAVRVTNAPGSAQNVVAEPGVIEARGKGFTTIGIELETAEIHPLELVVVTVYVPLCVAIKLGEDDAAWVGKVGDTHVHWYKLDPGVACSVTEAPGSAQNSVVLSAVITGVGFG